MRRTRSSDRRDRTDPLKTDKERVRKPSRNGKAIERVPSPAAASKNGGSAPDATDWRFHVATLMRVSDNLVSRAVGAYDRMFALDKREESEIYLEIGKKLADDEKLEEALRALRRVLRTKPDHEEALFEIGLIHVRQNVPRAAIEMLQKAKAAGMKSLRLNLLLADALGLEDRFAEALKELDGALAIKPNVADTHYRRGVTLDRLERHAEAVEAFEEAIRLAPRELRYHQSLGFTLETMGQRSSAIKCFKRALELERQKELETSHPDE
jgi:tetratricopeptide (TPR) repeat protein